MKRRIKTLSWRKDHKLKRGTVVRRDACHRGIHQRNIRDKKRVLIRCHIVTFIEEEGEDILVAGRPQIRGVSQEHMLP